jgi:hypothetical protein
MGIFKRTPKKWRKTMAIFGGATIINSELMKIPRLSWLAVVLGIGAKSSVNS